MNIANTPLTLHPVWPWLLGLGTALWFGLMGWSRNRNGLALRGIGGFALGLLLGTISSGLANAVAVPYTQAVISRCETVAFVISVFVVALVGLSVRIRRRSPAGSIGTLKMGSPGAVERADSRR